MKSLPNILTLARAIAGPVGAIAYVIGWQASQAFDNDRAALFFFISLVLLLGSALTDYIDGWLARQMGATSSLGALLDPLADKLLVNAYLVAFLIRFEFDPILALPVVVIIGRDIIITLKRLGRPVADQRDLQVSQTAKLKTGFQMIILILPFALDLLDITSWFYVWVGGVWFIALLSLYTGWAYLKPSR